MTDQMNKGFAERMTEASNTASAAAAGDGTTDRRSFLGWMLGIGTVTVGALLSVPLVKFALHPLVTTTTKTGWSDLGATDDFASITAPVKKTITVEQVDGWRKIISQKSVYVIKESDGSLKVLSAICPHLGCSIPWQDAQHEFICPCHHGVFAADGKLISGPPPRGMDELPSQIADGHLQVQYHLYRQLVPTKEIIA